MVTLRGWLPPVALLSDDTAQVFARMIRLTAPLCGRLFHSREFAAAHFEKDISRRDLLASQMING